MISRLLKVLFIIIILSGNSLAQSKTITNLVPPVSYFINHVSQFKAIRENLEKHNQVSITGISGMGKTQLARMYAYENKENYNIIWFFDCALDLNDQFARLAKEMNLALNTHITEDRSTAKQEVLEYLQSQKNWLLVFDNLKVNENTKIQDLTTWEHNGHIIFCSQDSSKLNYQIPVSNFKKQDAISLVKLILDGKRSDTVNFLVEEFQGYPILLVQGAQILNKIKGLDYRKYKEMIKNSDNKIRLNIELCMKELTSSAKELLKQIALINNQSFSKKMLYMITKNKEGLDDDIYQLSRFLLISNTDANQENPLFEMHDIIAATIQELSLKTKNQQYLEEMISSVLEESFPKGVTKRHMIRTSSTVDENLQVILRNAEKYNINILKNLELRLELLGTSTNIGDYETSKDMIKWFNDKEENKEFHLDKMNNHQKYVYALYLDLIGCYNNYALSNPAKAIEYFTRAKKIASTVDGYEYMKFNVNYQLFRTLLDLGQIEDAQKTLIEASNIYEKGIQGNNIESSEAGYLYVGKTRLSLAQEKYKEALEHINKGLETLKQTNLKETDVFLETSYQLKIEALNGLHKYSDAYSLAQWLYETFKPSLDSDHEIFANLHTKMAISQYGLGNYQESLEDVNKAIKMFVKVRNLNEQELQFSRDIQLAKALIIKADCLSVLNRIEESLNIYEKAEAIHNNVYIENLNTSSSLRNLLFKAAKTACKKSSKSNEFWFKHFYGQLRLIFGIDTPQVKEIEQTCNPEIYKTY